VSPCPPEGFDSAVGLIKKLRMRAKVTLNDVSNEYGVLATSTPLGDTTDHRTAGVLHEALLRFPADPRWAGLGLRGVAPKSEYDEDADAGRVSYSFILSST
jgi:hypothetical protein